MRFPVVVDFADGSLLAKTNKKTNIFGLLVLVGAENRVSENWKCATEVCLGHVDPFATDKNGYFHPSILTSHTTIFMLDTTIFMLVSAVLIVESFNFMLVSLGVLLVAD